MLPEIIQYPGDGRQIAQDQIPVTKIHHMVVYHEDVENGKARYDIHIYVGITAVQQTVRALRAAEIIDGLPCQPVIRRDGIGVEDLGTGVHRVLQLFIEGAVHIRFMHTPSEGTQADLPDT